MQSVIGVLVFSKSLSKGRVWLAACLSSLVDTLTPHHPCSIREAD